MFFTDGILPTVVEAAKIAMLNEAAQPAYKVIVGNSQANSTYGELARLIPCDFVAGGTIPAIYEDVPILDPENLPVTGLKDTQVVINNAVDIEVPVNGTFVSKITPIIEDGEIVRFVLS